MLSDVVVYIHVLVYVYIDVLCDALHWTAHERLNEEITLIYSAAVLDTNSEPTSVSLRTLVSEISSIVLTASSLCTCTLNSNNLKLKIRSFSEYIQSNIQYSVFSQLSIQSLSTQSLSTQSPSIQLHLVKMSLSFSQKHQICSTHSTAEMTEVNASFYSLMLWPSFWADFNESSLD